VGGGEKSGSIGGGGRSVNAPEGARLLRGLGKRKGNKAREGVIKRRGLPKKKTTVMRSKETRGSREKDLLKKTRRGEALRKRGGLESEGSAGEKRENREKNSKRSVNGPQGEATPCEEKEKGG